MKCVGLPIRAVRRFRSIRGASAILCFAAILHEGGVFLDCCSKAAPDKRQSRRSAVLIGRYDRPYWHLYIRYGLLWQAIRGSDHWVKTPNCLTMLDKEKILRYSHKHEQVVPQ